MAEIKFESVPSVDDSIEGQVKQCLMELGDIMERRDSFGINELRTGVRELERLLGEYNNDPSFDVLFNAAAKEKLKQAKDLLESLETA